MLAAFMPSILHRIDTQLLAQRLDSSILHSVGISHVRLLLEAITAPAAGEAYDYNRLEYLGDAVLKVCAHIQVLAQHPTYPEGYLTAKKGTLVSNGRLARAALELGLDGYIIAERFTGSKWRPVCMDELRTSAEELQATRRELSSKVLADVAEALIGASYVDGGLEKAYTCVRTVLNEEVWFPHSESFSRLIAGLPPCMHTDLDRLEKLVGHNFEHKTLLVEAITHASFPSHRYREGTSYERLEFLGDSILDLILVPKLHAHPRQLKHWELHRIHEALVNGHFLGYCCMSCGIDEGRNRITKDLEIEQAAERFHLHDFMRAGGQVVQAKVRCLEMYSQYGKRIEEVLDHGTDYPWPDLVALAPAKFFSDLIESVLGALYIDTRGDAAVCEAFLDKLGIIRRMQRILDDCVETTPVKERVGILADKDAVEYRCTVKDNVESGDRVYACTVMVGDVAVTTAQGQTKEEAEVRAAFEAAKVLEARFESGGGNRKRKLGDAQMHDGDTVAGHQPRDDRTTIDDAFRRGVSDEDDP